MGVASTYFPTTLKSHTPQIWGVKFPPRNLGGEPSKIPCFTAFSQACPPNSGGEIITPQIWGVMGLREYRSQGPMWLS